MAEIPLYEGDTIVVQWGQFIHECQVWRSDELCVRCDGATVRLEPPWETWTLLCCAECALTTTQADYKRAVDLLKPGAIGMVSSIPVRVSKKENPSCLNV
jgi:hypothetical protein